MPSQLPLPIRTGTSLGHWACTTWSGSSYPWFWSVMYTYGPVWTSSPISSWKWPTMWLPRPIMHRSPMRTTGSETILWPGTIPAEMLTWGPTSVSRPTSIQRSPKMAPGGKARQLPDPKAPNRAAGTSPGPMAPCRATQCHPALIHQLIQRWPRAGGARSGEGCRTSGGEAGLPLRAIGRVLPDEPSGPGLPAVTARRYLIPSMLGDRKGPAPHHRDQRHDHRVAPTPNRHQ